MSKQRAAWGILIGAVALVLLSHRSDNPYILIYSLPYLVFLVLFGVTALGLFTIFARFNARAWFLILAVTAPLIAIGAVIECVGQVYAWRYPSFEVLHLEPDRQLGWKQVPNLSYTWTGPGWAAFEFSVPVKANAEGFRDHERVVAKADGVKRVAVLGDSLVEALQVPLDQTAGGVLERRLNSKDGRLSETATGHEVLNFGVSNYGVGQYLLTWRHHASKYNPDYVFAIVAEFHMRRAVNEFSSNSQGRRRLAVTPTFRLEQGELIEQPAKDFDKFVEAQRQLIDSEYNGLRIRQRPAGLILWKVLDRVCSPLANIQWNMEVHQPSSKKTLTEDDKTINFRILDELGKSVHSAGGHFIIVDAVRFFNDFPDLSARLKSLCEESHFGYLDLAEHFRKKSDEGIKMTWRYDGHFNSAGNETFAEAMEQWLVQNAAANTANTVRSERVE